MVMMVSMMVVVMMVVFMILIMVMMMVVLMILIMVMMMVVLMILVVVMMMVVLMVLVVVMMMVMFMIPVVVMNVLGFFLFSLHPDHHMRSCDSALYSRFLFHCNARYQGVHLLKKGLFLFIRKQFKECSCKHIASSTHSAFNVQCFHMVCLRFSVCLLL